MKIALVSCTKLKANYPCSTREMYQESTLFKKAVKFIEQKNYDEWYVLSAKYGLLKQHDVIEPYDLTLNNMKAAERKNWSEIVIKQLDNLQINITQIDFYAGAKYREYLIPVLEEKGIVCNVPLKGKGIGEQLQYYTLNTK
ncbi:MULTISPECIES: DUF6884 domain-containing protein [unclassified Bacillus (in: firmicutes)]|uniref:DUF6884 domain-containing protein n=1 Tax=unclassified Bacillus (in: firmicutes) TaxID=185979 RepID=UPI001BEA9FAD|nr:MULTISPECIES: DUF6884 domain-containing protein [unclassified Bacillus (in: firmicutes)]MBT2616128.1 hypothetical protein [Bacillus sp. ISL-78]MBT2628422.1 hypothetical protein [Bacillus sp. ISL-101]